jgi:hypothetical protein
MSSVGDSLRRFLDTLSKLEDHDDVRSVTRDENGDVRVALQARTLADEPFVELHDDLTEASETEPHLFEPTDDDSAGGPTMNSDEADEEGREEAP